MQNGMIKPDSDAGKEIGFLSVKFSGWLWKKDDVIIISFIESKARGNFKELIETIRSKGFRVDIPTPLGRMQDIVLKNGYVHHIVHDEDMGPVDVWSLG
jgi:hypothetical protein